jgi:choloylglycine hydrolase
MNNFDIPKGLARECASPEDFHLGYTQRSVVADVGDRIYYYWTMYDRKVRSVDLSKLDFQGKTASLFPPRSSPDRRHPGPLKRLSALTGRDRSS